MSEKITKSFSAWLKEKWADPEGRRTLIVLFAICMFLGLGATGVF